MAMKKIIVSIALVLLAGAAQAQARIAKVPFEWINGSIFVRATVDSIEGRYFVDTGAPMAILHSRAQKSEFQKLGEMPIIDPNGKRTDGIPVVHIKSLEMGEYHTRAGGLQALVLPKDDGLEFTGSDGVVGASLMAEMVVRFDSRQGIITLSDSVKQYGLKEKDGMPMRMTPAGHIFVNVKMGKKATEEVMFDTGSNNFLSLSEKGYNQLNEAGVLEPIATIKSPNNRRTNRVKTQKFDVGRGKFANVTADVLTGGPVSLLGVQLLKHGIVTIDYPNKRFYFEPFSKKRVDIYEPVWDITIKSVMQKLHVATVWDNVDPRVEPNDEVVAVDGITYEGDDADNYLKLQRESTATKHEITIRKKDGTEFTVTSYKK